MVRTAPLPAHFENPLSNVTIYTCFGYNKMAHTYNQLVFFSWPKRQPSYTAHVRNLLLTLSRRTLLFEYVTKNKISISHIPYISSTTFFSHFYLLFSLSSIAKYDYIPRAASSLYTYHTYILTRGRKDEIKLRIAYAPSRSYRYEITKRIGNCILSKKVD